MDYLAITRGQTRDVAITIAIGLGTAVAAYVSATRGDVMTLAASMGALGGLSHEIVQSHGKILFFREADDGIYIGSIASMVLGAIAGLLVARGLVAHAPGSVPPPIDQIQLKFEAFFAGLGLKGILDAAGSQPPSNLPKGTGSDPKKLRALLPQSPTEPPTARRPQ